MPQFEGKDILDFAHAHVGEQYILGAKAPLANKSWKGPWDCAEFVSWCTYQAYNIVYAVRPPNPVTGESYSGWWYDDAKKIGVEISQAKAIATIGAILVRKPNFNSNTKIGHVAISLGDGRTIEAKDAANGVCIVPKAKNRLWSLGVLLPGIKYEAADTSMPKNYAAPTGLLHLDSPYMRGSKVLALQQALSNIGLFPGQLDGVFGPLTSAAVQSFQAKSGLVVDGVVGAETRAALRI